MNWLHALCLGLIQGVSEFFPVSSSAHLKVFKTFFNIPTGEETVLFDLFCHVGTLLALSTISEETSLNSSTIPAV